MTIQTAKDNGEGYTDVEIKCNIDGAIEEVRVPTQGFYEWVVRGVLIQKAMPTVSVDDREMLTTSLCHVCLENIYNAIEEGE